MGKRAISLFLALCLTAGLTTVPAAAEETVPDIRENEVINVEAETAAEAKLGSSPESGSASDSEMVSALSEGISVWDGSIAAGFASGQGTEENPYLISSASQLAYLAQMVNSGEDYYHKYFKLTCDIDLNHIEWAPIGTDDDPFRGSFDGAGYRIIGLHITQFYEYAGLFGRMYAPAEGTTICNLSVDGNIEISGAGTTKIGMLLGECEDHYGDVPVVFNNCVASGEIMRSGEDDYTNCIGGILGEGDNIELLNSQSRVEIVGEKISGRANTGIGGLIGYLRAFSDSNAVRILDCGFTGSVAVSSDDTTGLVYIGGIIGNLASGASTVVRVESCYNAGSLRADGRRNITIGGIIAYPSSDGDVYISNCYNSGALSSTARSFAVAGGILGDNRCCGTISNCYNSGEISGVTSSKGQMYVCSGGLIGWDYHPASFTYCYNIGQVSALCNSGSGYAGGAVGRNSGSESYTSIYCLDSVPAIGNDEGLSIRSLPYFAMQMQVAYRGFDFENVWEMGGDSYHFPVLRGMDNLNGTWEKTDVEDSNVEIDTGHYYSITAMRSFRIYAQGAGYPAPVGFTVTVGDQVYTGYADGSHVCDMIDVWVEPGYTGDIEISRDGYHTQRIPAEYTSMLNYIAMVPTSVTDPFANALLLDKSSANYAAYRNLLQSGETMYQRDLTDTEEELISLYPMVEWNGHGEGTVWLEQGEIRVPLTNNTFNQVDWGDYLFAAGETIYLCAEAADGTGLRYATNLKVIAKLHSGLEINLGEDLEIDTGASGEGDLSIFGGEKLEFDLAELSDDLIPIEVTVKGDGSIQGTIGFALGEASDKEAVFGSMKDSIDRLAEAGDETGRAAAKLLEEMKQYGVPIERAGTFGAKGTAQLLGYFTGKMVEGQITLTECKMAVLFSGSLSYTYNTLILNIPAYFKMSLGSKLEAYLKMVYDEASGAMNTEDGQRLDTSFSLSAEAGPGWEGYVSVGVKGSGILKISSVLPLTERDTALSLRAAFSAVGTLAGIEGEWLFYETPEKVFWDSGEWCWKDADDPETQVLSFSPRLAAVPMSVVGNGNTLVTGISGYQSPALAQLSDGRMLAVWMADVPDRSLVDNGGVYYSICTDGTWSEPTLAADDGTNDSAPRLHQEDGVLYLAWQNYQTVFETDTLPDYDVLAGQIETVVSAFDPDTDTWSAPEAGTPGWYTAAEELPEDYADEWPVTDSTRQVLSENGMRGVLYTAAEDDTGLPQVWGIFSEDGNWGEPVQLTSAVGGVNGFSAVMDGEKITILLTTGEYDNSALMLHEVALNVDLSVTDVDYVRQTLVPGQALTLEVSVKNNSPVNAVGMVIRVANSNGAELTQKTVMAAIPSGGEELVYVNYQLPETLVEDELHLTVTPLLWADTDESDNTAMCKLQFVDLSVESLTAVTAGGQTQAVVQVVNRGQTETAPTDLTFYRDSPDGEVLATAQTGTLAVGVLDNVSVILPALNEDDLVYVKAEPLGEENLIGNNTLHAVVTAGDSAETDISATAGRTKNVLTVTARIDNRTASNLEPVTLAVAAYEEKTGRQLDCALFENVTVTALNSEEYRVEFSLPSGTETVLWKVFCLDESWSPITGPLTGRAQTDQG